MGIKIRLAHNGLPNGTQSESHIVIRKSTIPKLDCFAPYSRSQWQFKFIPKVDKKVEKYIVCLVDKVIKGKKDNIDTKKLEEEIDNIVYGLYGLSDMEIGIIKVVINSIIYIKYLLLFFLVYIDLLYIIWYTPKCLEDKIWLKIKNMIGV